MNRNIKLLGEFLSAAGVRQRWLAVSASTKAEHARAVGQAINKGWEPIALYEGVDPETAWPCTWLAKDLSEPEPLNSTVPV